ncbi:hypothetical protein J6A32_07110 [Methanocorpusculum sp.]|nr:hypothetical protein [Methanocorpusculum sp.]
MSETEDFRVLDALMRDDEILFRVGIGHLLSVGYANLTEEAVSRTIEEIEADALADEEVELRMISPAYQVAILRMAAKIREVPLWTLLKYISKKVKIS